MSDDVSVKASQHESYNTFTILAFLLPPAGLLLGILFMAKDNKLDRKLGEHILAVSIIFMIVYGVAWAIWAAHNSSMTAIPTSY